jgi:type IV secretory pathway TraG/TraD family ATPase VirD4
MASNGSRDRGVPLGTAALLDPPHVRRHFSYRQGTVWLGCLDNGEPLGSDDDRHVCLVSGNRGGKGTTSIINNLCLWEGSLVVVDPKGENATVTAARRGRGSKECDGLNQVVHVLDPFKAASVDESLRSRFNPLDTLDPTRAEIIDEAGRVADALVIVRENSNEAFFDESARALVKVLLLHIVTSERFRGRRNLITLRKLILRGDKESVEALRASGETDIPSGHELLWTDVTSNTALGGMVADLGDRFFNMVRTVPKQYEGVLQTADLHTNFIDSPEMARCLETSDFKLSELKTRPEGMSLFLSLPQRFSSTHSRWLRMMVALTVTEMEKVKGQPATGHRVLMMLDEFAALKRLEVFETFGPQIAGFGVKLFYVLQNLGQLKANYGASWDTFLGNASLKLFFAVEDQFTREYISKTIGETEVVRDAGSVGDNWSTNVSTSTSETTGGGTSVSDSVTLGGAAQASVSTGGASTPMRTSSGSTNWSRTHGTGSQENWSGTTGHQHGESQGGSRGTSETFHRRPLFTPDEIGKLFARIQDRSDPRFPGLGLALVSEGPFIYRKVNYHEDYFFLRKFSRHPDHPPQVVAREQLTRHALAEKLEFLSLPQVRGAFLPRIRLLAEPGTIVKQDAGVAEVAVSGLGQAVIRAPRAGVLAAASPLQPDRLPEVLFSMFTYQAEDRRADSLRELDDLCDKALEKLRSTSMKYSKIFAAAAGVSGLTAAVAVTADLGASTMALALAPVPIAAWALMKIRRARAAMFRRPGAAGLPAKAPSFIGSTGAAPVPGVAGAGPPPQRPPR